MDDFKPGDLVQRKPIYYNPWWMNTCNRRGFTVNQIFTVKYCEGMNLTCEGWGNPHDGNVIRANPENFILVSKRDPKYAIEQRINKLYSKCKTTAHWSK